MPRLLWFRQGRDEAAILASLTNLAARHGYINSAGKRTAEAIKAGFVAVMQVVK